MSEDNFVESDGESDDTFDVFEIGNIVEMDDDEFDELLNKQLKFSSNLLARQLGIGFFAPLAAYYIVKWLGVKTERFQFERPKLKNFLF